MKRESSLCPRCKDRNEWSFRDVRWPRGKPEEAFCQCPKCGGPVRDVETKRYARRMAETFLKNWRNPGWLEQFAAAERSPSPQSGNGPENQDSASSGPG